MSKQKIVYTVVCADYLHIGHINIIEKSAKLGKLMVGVLTDSAIAAYKRVPILPYAQRVKTVSSIKGVWKVVPQETLDYTKNLRKYKPDIVTNGDDWKQGVQKETRANVIKILKEWDGKLIEFSYTKEISSTKIINALHKEGITPDVRLSRLKRIINTKPIVRVLEAHNGLSALVVENAKVQGKEFDAIWESSFTDSSSKGKPDIELVDFTSRIQTINEILEVTTKPLIVDLDTGGQIEHFSYMVRTLERLGVSAVVIEDKRFPKINSLMEGAKHIQEEAPKFADKISEGKKARLTEDFMIFARIESLILGKSIQEAIGRAVWYIKAGADGIVIHSKDATPDKIFEFCKYYKDLKEKVPLIVIPTTYNSVFEEELTNIGVSVVIYANHLLRTAYKNMVMTSYDILYYGRSKEACDYCSPVKEIFELTNKEVLKRNQSKI